MKLKPAAKYSRIPDIKSIGVCKYIVACTYRDASRTRRNDREEKEAAEGQAERTAVEALVGRGGRAITVHGYREYVP